MTAAARRRFAALSLGAWTLVASSAQAQFCPSYTTCRTPPSRALNPSPTELGPVFDRIAQGPARYGGAGWSFPATLPDGCGLPTAPRDVPAVFPCVLLKAVALTESQSWRQFCVPTAPSPGVSSQTLIRSDCGYGLMGISRGMHPGETSEFDPARLASDPGYNISVGAGQLAEAWRAMPCIGDRRIAVLEDWYFALWAYGGLSYSNNPSNPMYRADRAPFRDPTGLAASEYPYQEVVLGWIRNPPSADFYAGVRVNMPRRSEICGTCGGPNANARDPDEIHPSDCPGAPSDGGADAAIDVPRDVSRDAVLADLAAIDVRSDVQTDVVAPDVPAADSGTIDDVAPTTTLAPGGCGCGIHTRPASAQRLCLGLALMLAARRRRVRL